MESNLFMGTIAMDGCEIEAWNTMFDRRFLVPSSNASITIDHGKNMYADDPTSFLWSDCQLITFRAL